MTSSNAYSLVTLAKILEKLSEHEKEWAGHFGDQDNDLTSYCGTIRIELTARYDQENPNSIVTKGLFDKYLQKLDPLVKNKFMAGSHMHPATPGKEGNRLIIMVNAIVLLLISLMPVDEQPLFDANQRKFCLIDRRQSTGKNSSSSNSSSSSSTNDNPSTVLSTVLWGTITIGTAEAKSVSSLHFNWPRFPLSVAMKKIMLLYGINGKDICAILIIAILLFGEWRTNPMVKSINLRNLGFGVDWLSNLGYVFGGRVDLYIATFIGKGNSNNGDGNDNGNDDGNPGLKKKRKRRKGNGR